MIAVALRPAHPHALEPGYGWVAIPDEQWRLDPSGQKCRHSTRQKCPNRPVAELERWRWARHQGRVPSWWAYCAEHMYGRWIEDGRVMRWVVRKLDGR